MLLCPVCCSQSSQQQKQRVVNPEQVLRTYGVPKGVGGAYASGPGGGGGGGMLEGGGSKYR